MTKNTIYQLAIILIVCGFIISSMGMYLFWLGIKNVDNSWNNVIFRDFFNTYSQNGQISWNDWGDDTTTGFLSVKETYNISLLQLQTGFVISMIGTSMFFFSIGYGFCQKMKRL